jgi:isoquinoline 1-oxidoreductase beta subunit
MAQPISRRHFLVAGASGLTIGIAFQQFPGLVGVAGAANQTADATTDTAALSAADLNAYIHISTDSTVTMRFGGCELGQGTKTSLAQIAAEELHVPWASVTVVQADADPNISYVTFGSSAIMTQFLPLATAGAAAREMLVSAAANKWGVSPSDCTAAGGKVSAVVNGVTKRLAYGQLASAAALLPVPPNPTLTDPSQYKIIGKPIPRVDIPSKVNGSAIYGMDVRVPGMVFAAIRHAPRFSATLKVTPAVPAGATAVVPVKTIEARGATKAGVTNAVAVVATNTWAAMQGAKALQPVWHVPTNVTDLDSTNIRTQADTLMASGTPILGEPASGDVDAALAAATTTIDATYYVPYLPHSNLEVLNCTVSYTGTACEIWAPTQSAQGVVSTAQQVTGLAANAITVHQTLLGGGLGRKLENDFVAQAIQVAMAISQPVMLVYPREEDFANDQYRPFGLINVKAAVDGNTVPAWKYRIVAPSVLGQHGFLTPGDPDIMATGGATGLSYPFGASRMEWVPHPAGIPVGFWRSVAHSMNTFAVESAIDELAAAASIDPFVFRKGLLAGNARATALLNAADTLSSWRKTLPANHGWGMAYSEGFGSVMCQVVDVSQVTATSLHVGRVACVIDCGRAINPDPLVNQIEGGIAQGLSAALWGEITFAKGAASVRNYDHFRVARMADMPKVTVKILSSDNPIGGIGESGVPPVAPAIANALFRLNGTRVRTLPFFPGKGLPFL